MPIYCIRLLSFVQLILTYVILRLRLRKYVLTSKRLAAKCSPSGHGQWPIDPGKSTSFVGLDFFGWRWRVLRPGLGFRAARGRIGFRGHRVIVVNDSGFLRAFWISKSLSHALIIIIVWRKFSESRVSQLNFTWKTFLIDVLMAHNFTTSYTL